MITIGSLLSIAYKKDGDQNSLNIASNNPEVYRGTRNLKKLELQYQNDQGKTVVEKYDVASTGTVGPFTYSKEGNEYVLVFNGESYMNKKNVLINYYY